MKKVTGVWLDHKQAYIVSLTKKKGASSESQEQVERIQSNIEGRINFTNRARSARKPPPGQDTALIRKKEERVKLQLRKYFQQILNKIGGADQIIILGPGEAKTEFKKEIDKSGRFIGKIKKIETADKMTEKQLANKVKIFFRHYL